MEQPHTNAAGSPVGRSGSAHNPFIAMTPEVVQNIDASRASVPLTSTSYASITPDVLDNSFYRQRNALHAAYDEGGNGIDSSPNFFRSDDDSDFDEEEELLMLHKQKHRKYVQCQQMKSAHISRAPSSQKSLWCMFDDCVMKKTHIELLNIRLSTTGHSLASVLFEDAALFDKDSARKRFNVILGPTETEKKKAATEGGKEDVRICLASILQGDLTSPAADTVDETLWPSRKSSVKSRHRVAQLNKSKFEPAKNIFGQSKSLHGFWARYFSVEDIDEMWRAIVTQAYFWGDRGASLMSVHLAAKDASEDSGFDTLTNEVGGLYRKQNERKCVITVPAALDKSDIRRVGITLLRVLSTKQKRAIFFQECRVPIQKLVNTEEEHTQASKYKLSCHNVKPKPLKYRPGSTPTFITNKRKRTQAESPMDTPLEVSYNFAELHGITWKPVADFLPEN